MHHHPLQGARENVLAGIGPCRTYVLIPFYPITFAKSTTDGMERVICVPHAKVPIVKFWDPELQLACDMNVNNTLALENTRMIKTYVEIDERVRPLAMIIKHWTKRRILNDAGTSVSYLLGYNAYSMDSSGWHAQLIYVDMHDPQLPANTKPSNITDPTR